MPDKIIQPVANATPAPAAPAATPAAAPVATPAARTPSTPAPKNTKPTTPAKPKNSSVRLNRPPKSISAKKALGEDVGRESAAVSKRQLESYNARNPVGARYEEPAEEVETPAAPIVTPPATPVEKPAEATPAAVPAAEQKVKINGKEYSVSELEEMQREREAAQAAPSEPQDRPMQEAPQPTAEELAQREAQFLEQTSGALEAPLTEQEMDKILGGGKEAIETLTNLRKRDMATAILHARKGIAEGINPIVKDVFKTLQPLVQAHQSVARHNVKTQFVAKHADFAPHMATCEQVADELIRLYPQQVSQMTPENFIDEVARQSDALLKKEHLRWFPDKAGNWRAGGLTPQAAATTPAPAAQAAPALDPAAQPQAAPAPMPAAAVPAPAATLPGSQGRMGKVSWSKSVASTLRG